MTSAHARRASEGLVKALIDLAAKGLRTHCSDVDTHHYWLSEIEAERQQAALWCHGYPIIQACADAAAANDERFGVWGGRDYPRRPGRPKRQEAA